MKIGFDNEKYLKIGDDVILGREVAADRRKDGNTTS